MNLARLLVAHALVTLAAGLVLIVLPNLISGTVGIWLAPSQYLLSYLLGASELGTAFLSFFAAKLRDVQALRLVSRTFIVFHLATAAVEVCALAQNGGSSLWLNVVLRIGVAALFVYYGLFKTPVRTGG